MKKPLGELHQPVIVGRYGGLANPAYLLVQTALTPIVSGGLLGARRLTQARSFQQGSRCGRIECGIISRRERVITPRHRTTGVLIYECA